MQQTAPGKPPEIANVLPHEITGLTPGRPRPRRTPLPRIQPAPSSAAAAPTTLSADASATASAHSHAATPARTITAASSTASASTPAATQHQHNVSTPAPSAHGNILPPQNSSLKDRVAAPSPTSSPTPPSPAPPDAPPPPDTSNDLALAEQIAATDVELAQIERGILARIRTMPPLASSRADGGGHHLPDEASTGSLLYPHQVTEPKFIREHTGDLTISKQLEDASFVKITPRVNGPLTAAPPGNADRERLLLRLDMYCLTEKIVKGDGACQFRSLSDQLYGTPEHPTEVRAAVVEQLQERRDKYSMYVPTDFDEYVAKMALPATWGDHVTLQAAADKFGCRIMVLTSYRENCVIAIDPEEVLSQRTLWLSFWAEVHYNSLQSKEDMAAAAAAGPPPPPHRASWPGNHGGDGAEDPAMTDACWHVPGSGLLARATRAVGRALTGTP